MKEIVVISGKGGTGKTSITSSFAYLGGKDMIVADCDVDAADMHLLMHPKILRKEDFYSSLEAKIDTEKCTNCGKCFDVCRFDAISVLENSHKVIPLNCEGCSYCEKVCPEEAIEMNQRLDGEWYISNTRLNTAMVHAKLGIGTENSGKLVATVKNISRQLAEKYDKKFILVDGSPGVGCPVISSLSGAAYVVLVTEPSVSGIHDLQRVFELVKKFNLPAGIIINKYDLNTKKYNEILEFIVDAGIEHIANLPYDENFTKAMTAGITIVEYDDGQIKETIEKAWDRIEKILED